MKIIPVVMATNSSLLCFFATSYCLAQSTPSEFAQMSLQELFNQSIYDTEIQQEKPSAWTLKYQYKAAEFEGYLDGSQAISYADVLWNKVPEDRTDKNFPILPTTITQEAHVFALRYQFNSRWQGHISLPYIKQKTDHESIVPNYNTFTIASKGIGDTSILASYNLDSYKWRLSLGVSLPTGSIDKKGDTPRAAGDQQLPYTMQLGSGTYDFPIELSYQSSLIPNLNMNMSANIRTGTNDRNYRLGNNYSLNGRYKIDFSQNLQVFAGLAFQYSGSIHGQDNSLLINSPFPYPAGITNPKLYGGKKVNAGLGVLLQLPSNYQLNLELGKPVYQNLNGPQPKEKWRSSLYISKAL